jgi:hypothetical protein
MFTRIGSVAAGLALAAGLTFIAGAAMAEPVAGTVVRVDPGSRVLVFDDGRMWQVAGTETIIVDGTPVTIETIRPGSRVSVSNAQLVQLRDGRYVVVAAAAPTGVRQTVYGTVTDVDRDGQVTIKTPEGREFDVRIAPNVAAGVKKNDSVRMDLIFGPAGSVPAASPATR